VFTCWKTANQLRHVDAFVYALIRQSHRCASRYIFTNGYAILIMNSLERVKAAHKKSIFHRSDITASKICGCFHCGHIFPPLEIEQWTHKNGKGIGQTALCPKCSIDSVIGDKSGFPVISKFLGAMKDHWFSVIKI